MKLKWKPLLLHIAIPLGVGGLSGFLTRKGIEAYQYLDQPPLSPPKWVFPVVWTGLFTMMGIASYLVGESDAPREEKAGALRLYGLQLAVNFLWPIFFFNLRWLLFSFLWLLLLWVLVFQTRRRFKDISPTAGGLLVPYLLWLTFAAYLNFGTYWLNR